MKRRALLGISAGAFVGIAGCSLRDSTTRIKLSVQNFAEARQTVLVSMTHDGSEVFSQYIEAPSASPNQKPQIETIVSLGQVSNGDRVDISASLVGDPTSTGASKTIDCSGEQEIELVAVSIEAGGTLTVTGDGDANLCTETGIETPEPEDRWG